MKADESADSQSALSSAFLVMNVFEITRIWAGFSFSGAEGELLQKK
jgi:hypothetical protein